MLELKNRYMDSFEDFLNFPTMILESSDSDQKIVYSLGATETSKMFRQSNLKALSNDLSETLDSRGQEKYDKIRQNFLGLLEAVKRRHDEGLLSSGMDYSVQSSEIKCPSYSHSSSQKMQI